VHLVDGERFNSMTHIAGAAPAAVGGVFLLAAVRSSGDGGRIASSGVYAATMLHLYLASSLYHSARGAAKDILRKLDHCAIYLLIAGTYIPFSLVTLGGTWGWSMFGAVWTLAVFGIVQEIWYARGARILSLVIYLVMGRLALIGASRHPALRRLTRMPPAHAGAPPRSLLTHH
jgi:hemolysin III